MSGEEDLGRGKLKPFQYKLRFIGAYAAQTLV